jgi:hypothetical protein
MSRRSVEVTWTDAYDIGEWQSEADTVRQLEEYKGFLVKTRGWLVVEDDQKIAIARDWSPEVKDKDDHSLRAIMVIPRKWVLEVRELPE